MAEVGFHNYALRSVVVFGLASCGCNMPPVFLQTTIYSHVMIVVFVILNPFIPNLQFCKNSLFSNSPLLILLKTAKSVTFGLLFLEIMFLIFKNTVI